MIIDKFHRNGLSFKTCFELFNTFDETRRRGVHYALWAIENDIYTRYERISGRSVTLLGLVNGTCGQDSDLFSHINTVIVSKDSGS